MRSLTDRRQLTRAFTLIELMVVIIILAILAAVVVPRVVHRTDDARQAAARADLATIDSQLEAYRTDTGVYPSEEEGLAALVTNGSNNPKWNGPYLKGGVKKDPWGNQYLYKNPGQHGEYDLYSAGPDGQPGTQDDIGAWNLQQ